MGTTLGEWEEATEDNSQANPLASLEISGQDALANPAVSDRELIHFRSLTESHKPLLELPPDNMADMKYPQRFEAKCSICTSPYRDLAEHVFLENAQRPQAVVNFFRKYFGAKIIWETVATHMESHCVFKHIVKGGLKNIAMREEDVGIYKYRERDLVLTGLLVEIDDIRGMDCTRNPELELKRANTLERLYSRVLQIQKERDDAGTQNLDIFSLLLDLEQQIQCAEDKRVVRQFVRELRRKMSGPQD